MCCLRWFRSLLKMWSYFNPWPSFLEDQASTTNSIQDYCNCQRWRIKFFWSQWKQSSSSRKSIRQPIVWCFLPKTAKTWRLSWYVRTSWIWSSRPSWLRTWKKKRKRMSFQKSRQDEWVNEGRKSWTKVWAWKEGQSRRAKTSRKESWAKSWTEDWAKENSIWSKGRWLRKNQNQRKIFVRIFEWVCLNQWGRLLRFRKEKPKSYQRGSSWPVLFLKTLSLKADF